MRLRIKEWTLNLSSKDNIVIPYKYIAESLLTKRGEEDIPDIIILNEYVPQNNSCKKLKKLFEDKGYSPFYQGEDTINQTIMLVREELKPSQVNEPIKIDPLKGEIFNNWPYIVHVQIALKGTIYNVIGCRIRIGQTINYWKKTISDKLKQEIEQKNREEAKARKQQFDIILNYISSLKLENIIMVGDFNNYRDNTPVADWNLNVIDQAIQGKLIRETPKDSGSWSACYNAEEKSIFTSKLGWKSQSVYYFRLDHLFISPEMSPMIRDKSYDWYFVLQAITNKTKKSPNCVLDKNNNIQIKQGFPDHAIFAVTIETE